MVLATAALAALALLAPISAIPTPALAAEGTLTGVVRDASGAMVPDARITVAFLGGNRKEVTKTDQVGQFSLGPLPDGEYSVVVAKAGFALLSINGIGMENGIARRLELVVQPGRVTERMTVTSEAGGPAPAAQATDDPKRIRVGGNLQSAKLVKMPRPSYPAACKAEHVEGTVAAARHHLEGRRHHQSRAHQQAGGRAPGGVRHRGREAVEVPAHAAERRAGRSHH